MSRIFISYRRQDSPHMTGRIYDKLESVFGSNRVFRDIDDISAGEDFRAKLAKEIEKSDILLIIIGPKWESIADAKGNRRLDDPNDFVRLEVEAGLKRTDKIVIPVLVENAPMPNAANLPESLRELCYRNAISVRQDPDFHNDTQKLIREIKGIDDAHSPLYKKKPFLIAAGVIMIGILIAIISNIFISPPIAPSEVTSTNTISVGGETATAQIPVTDTAPTVAETVTEVVNVTNTPEPTNTPSRPVRIGVIQIPDYIFTDVLDRLQLLGFDAEWIKLSSDYAVLSEYDVIYLPIGWAFQVDLIDSRALQYRRFVEDGGGLIVEQPNSASSLTPDLLPYKLTFKLNQYDPNEWPPRIINTHEIVTDVSASELPGPGNKISTSDENWTIITASAQSNDPTLLVANFGSGRVGVFAASISENKTVRYQVGDKFIRQLIAWVNQ
ncbi:MAG TPA: toll/interleukin-1 receptor domain-containing protein [Anaerolineales bacterium]|nr:toll/interleukin-1 receptor domain-containing protein [Anaerolineales bacterium]